MTRRGRERPLISTPVRIGALACFWLAGNFAAVSAQPAWAEEARGWQTDFARAEAEARRLNKPLLIHFHASWCVPCQRMERDFLSSQELLDQFGEKLIAVQVDSDQHPELIERFEIQMLPSDVFVDPQGHILSRSSGATDRQSYFGKLAHVDKLWVEQSRLHEAARSRTRPAAREASDPPGPSSSAPAKPNLGLDGFSPVALWHDRKWLRGDPEFTSEYKGIVYYLASAEELSQFRAEPEKYAPQLLGCDPVVIFETDRAVPGNTQFGAYFQGDLFLFANTETRMRFKENPGRYARIRHVLRDENLKDSITR